MVIDSSALMAILLGEPETKCFNQSLEAASAVLISACSVLEASMVIKARKGDAGEREFDIFLTQLSPQVMPFDQQQLELARYAFATYGKGNHPAKFNMGDCFSYALAKAVKMPLLFKGNDFSQTDIQPALRLD